MSKLILHPGLYKTGTTSIQYSLHDSDAVLARNNLHYLNVSNIEGTPVKNHSIVIKSLFMRRPETFHVNVMRNWDPEAVNQHYRRELERELSENRDKTMVISAEGIGTLKKKELEDFVDFFSDYEKRTILYVRNPYHALCSRLQHDIKSGAARSVEDINPKYLNFQSRILKSMLGAFPGVEVYSFDEAKKNEGIVAHFARLLGIDSPGDIAVARKNEGLSYKLVCLAEYINKHEPGIKDGERNEARRGFDLPGLEFSTGKFLLREAQGEAIRGPLEQEVEEIHALSGIRLHCDMEYAPDLFLTPEEEATLAGKARPLNIAMRKLIWNFIQENSGGGKASKSSLFSLLERMRV